MALTETSRLMTIGETVAALRDTYPDVSYSSLRFLEREKLLEPVRTPGGHRLYRPSDLDRLRAIKQWQAERLSLAQIRQRLAARDRLVSPHDLSQRFLDFAIEGDFAAGSREILQADELGMPLAVVFEDVLSPALHEVGRRWADGSLTVGQEHEISGQVSDLVANLTLRHARPRPELPSVLAACVAGEHHDVGLRMVTGYLRQCGLRVHLLGADVAPVFLAESMLQRKPDVVLLSMTLKHHLPALRVTVNVLRQVGLPEVPRIIVGGQGEATAEDLGHPDMVIAGQESLGHIAQRILRSPAAS